MSGNRQTRPTFRSYAKINLYLDVLDKRPDGYHNIETIFQTVSLADELSFDTHHKDIRLTCSEPGLETDDRNLAYRAAQLLREAAGGPGTAGAHIHIEKRIPIAAGLAGGSGNAAATLIALNELWELGLSPERLRELALDLGSDVPYCTLGGTVAATGRGERLEALKPLPTTWFVLLQPRLAVPTGCVFSHPKLGCSEETPIAGRTPSFSAAIDAMTRGDIAETLFNRMERAVFHENPELAELKRRLLDLGCDGALMSGSGPAIFGICGDRETADRVAAGLAEYKVDVVRAVPRGAERIG